MTGLTFHARPRYRSQLSLRGLFSLYVEGDEGDEGWRCLLYDMLCPLLFYTTLGL